MRHIQKCLSGKKSRTSLVLGTQWGDEGKGKLVDVLAEGYDYCGRFNGGANAGHTVVANGQKYAFHLLPCGILYPSCKNILGNGVVVHLPCMFDELAQLDTNGVDYKGRLIISDRAHLVTGLQIAADGQAEARRQGSKDFLGTTKRGIGPTYSTKALRNGLRVGDLYNWNTFVEKYYKLALFFKSHFGIEIDTQQELDELKVYRDRLLDGNMIQDTVLLMHKILKEKNTRFLAEGANATMLDSDFGTYPYVTSSSTWAGGVSTGLGIPPGSIETTIGTVKAYTTRVGEGPFPTHLSCQVGQRLQDIGHEYGATTGRPRKCGWLDLVVVRYSHMLNNLSSINLTKLDVLSGLDTIQLGIGYEVNGQLLESMPASLEVLADASVIYQPFPGWQEDISHVRNFMDLPINAQNYVRAIEKYTGIPVSWIGVGPERHQNIQCY